MGSTWGTVWQAAWGIPVAGSGNVNGENREREREGKAALWLVVMCWRLFAVKSNDKQRQRRQLRTR